MKFSKGVITPTWGDISLSKYKSFEYQFEFFNDFSNKKFGEFSIDCNLNSHHGGIDLTFSIYKLFWVNINLHDTRHWNYDEGRWEE